MIVIAPLCILKSTCNLNISMYYIYSLMNLIIQIKQNFSKKIPSSVNGEDISNFTISGMDLITIYEFTVKSRLRMIFDLNVLLRNLDGSWNSTNAQEIITFAKNQNMELDWQLGNGNCNKLQYTC